MTIEGARPPAHPLLVPVDFSDCSKSALVYAAHVAEGTNTTLLVLHVVHEPRDRPGYYRSHDRSEHTLPLADIAEGMLEDFLCEVRRAKPELKALAGLRTMLVEGLPGDRILEVARREKAAMIIMGTNGRTGMARLLQGSVAREVSANAGAPVTTVKVPEGGWEQTCAIPFIHDPGDDTTAAEPDADAALRSPARESAKVLYIDI
jgi:nucleotide-binding universal stress UspA family protein